MEKIYMEDHQKKNHNSKQLQYTVVLSFAVAIFALFSLASFTLATYGNHGGVSYALPLTDEDFTMTYGKADGYNLSIQGGTLWFVPVYHANNNSDYPVFCIEHNVNPGIDDDYSKLGAITDTGLLYILSHSFANGKRLVTDANSEYSDYIETWVTQTAIWMYLYETDGTAKTDENSPNYIPSNLVEDAKATTKLTLYQRKFEDGNLTDQKDPITIHDKGYNIYEKYVAGLVNDAINYSNVKHVTVQISEDPASIAEDKSFYQSPIVTVTGNPAEDLTSYDVTINGVEGAYLVDEAGNDLSPINIPSGTKFYVRVPADKVGTETTKVTVNVQAHFTAVSGSIYTAAVGGDSLQKVVTVTDDVTYVLDGKEFTIIPTPPTGMNAVQTIYFIGLIVLLCGVGIVYANAKPVESKQ